MRVVHYREAFSPLSETFIYEYYRQHLTSGLHCSFYTFERVDPSGRPARNVRVLSLPNVLTAVGVIGRLYGKVPSIPNNEGTLLLRRAALREALATDRPSLVHAHFGNTGWTAHTAAGPLGIPTVVTFYGYDASQLPLIPRWMRRFRRLFAEAGAILVLSEDMRARLLELGSPAERTRVVHLARDVSTLPFHSKPGPVRRWLSVGRLVEKKGHADAIEAVARLVAEGRDIQLDIIGDGPLTTPLQTLIDQRHLSARVRLLGAISSQGVVAAMKDADGFVLCSKTASSGDREGTPTVLVEAQAMGLPCVSTVHAGIPEMFAASQRSDLATEGDIDAIVGAFKRILDSNSEQLHARTWQARQHVEAEFSIQPQAQRLVDVYAEVVERHRKLGSG